MLRRFFLRNPFLCVAILAGLAYGVSWLLRMKTGHIELGLAVFEVFYWLGRPFLWAGSFIHDLAPNLPDWQDRTLVILVGLLPYLAADGVLRLARIVAAKRRSAVADS